MAFKYLNPGYIPQSYAFSNNQAVRIVRGNIYNPRCGVALISDNTNCTIEDAITNGTNYLYIKFDIFLPETTTTTIYTDVVASIKRIFRIKQTGSTVEVLPLNNEDYTISGDDTNLKLGRVNTISLQLYTGGTNWSLTTYINDAEYPICGGLTKSNYSGIVNAGDYIIFSISNKQPVSNIIISDEEINFKEVIVEVDSSAVETTMTARTDGTYATAQIGDYVLKILDTSGLYGNFGSDCKVLGMAAVAAPAFATGGAEDVMLVKCRTISDTAMTDYPLKFFFDREDPDDYDFYYLKNMTEEQFAEINSSDTAALPCLLQALPVNSNTKLADLNGLKVGWVASDPNE